MQCVRLLNENNVLQRDKKKKVLMRVQSIQSEDGDVEVRGRLGRRGKRFDE